MRTIMKFTIPMDTGNQAIKNGTIAKTMESLLQDLHPETAYFFPENGKRTALLAFDMKDTSQLVEFGERVWLNLQAEVSFFPVMNAQELKAGLEKLTQDISRKAA